MPIDYEEQSRNILPSQQLGAAWNGTSRVRYGCAAKQGTTLMLAPFATLVFLAILWFLVSLIGDMVFELQSRVLAALRGETPNPAPSIIVSPRPTRVALRSRRPLRAQARLRAAA
jgi:hypothetical protein